MRVWAFVLVSALSVPLAADFAFDRTAGGFALIRWSRKNSMAYEVKLGHDDLTFLAVKPWPEDTPLTMERYPFSHDYHNWSGFSFFERGGGCNFSDRPNGAGLLWATAGTVHGRISPRGLFDEFPVRYRVVGVRRLIPDLATLACVLFWIVTLRRVMARLSRRYLSGGRICLECGYDLRASPHRCPECGTLARKFK